VAESSVGVWRDTVIVPPFSSMRIWMRFSDNHGFCGKTVFHCHFLAHEDTGMIHNLMISPPLGAAAEGEDSAQRLRGGGSDGADGSSPPSDPSSIATFLPFLVPAACAALVMGSRALRRRMTAAAKRGTPTQPQPATAGDNALGAPAPTPEASAAGASTVVMKQNGDEGRVAAL
jgi:hypothetical protein